MANQIKLTTVQEILTQALREIDVLDGAAYDDDAKGDPQKAQIGRSLHRLADTLQLASSLVRNEYWEGRR